MGSTGLAYSPSVSRDIYEEELSSAVRFAESEAEPLSTVGSAGEVPMTSQSRSGRRISYTVVDRCNVATGPLYEYPMPLSGVHLRSPSAYAEDPVRLKGVDSKLVVEQLQERFQFLPSPHGSPYPIRAREGERSAYFCHDYAFQANHIDLLNKDE